MRRSTYHHGDLRAELLTHVLDIVRDAGPAAVSIREVARRARVSHAAPAHHFRNKAGLLTAFAAEGHRRLATALEAAIANTSSGTDALQAMGVEYIRFALANPEHFAVMFEDAQLTKGDLDLIQAANCSFSPLLRVVQTAHIEGTLAAEPMVVAAAAWSLVHGLATLWLTGRLPQRTGFRDPDALIAAVTQLFAGIVLKP